MRYQIAVSGTREGLEKTVLAMIGAGWEPQGGVSYSQAQPEEGFTYTNGDGSVWAQAMVKHPREAFPL